MLGGQQKSPRRILGAVGVLGGGVKSGEGALGAGGGQG